MLSHLESKVEQKVIIVYTWFGNWEISMDTPLFLLGSFQSRDASGPIADKQKYLVNYKHIHNRSNMLFAGWEVHMVKNCDRVITVFHHMDRPLASK